MTIELVNWF